MAETSVDVILLVLGRALAEIIGFSTDVHSLMELLVKHSDE